LQARDGQVTVSGLLAEATIPATVYEPGVLFLKVTPFRRLLNIITGEKMLTIQVGRDGLLVDNVRLPLESNNMLLYLDPDKAPARHPDDVELERQAKEPFRPNACRKKEPTLWDFIDPDRDCREDKQGDA
jgi:hypothetical protein